MLALAFNGMDPQRLINVYVGGPLGEEPGWRVLGQPLAIAALGTRRGLLALGVVWGLWHAPLFAVQLNSGLYSSGLSGLAFYVFLLCPVISLLFYAVHRRSNGSVWACIGLHTSINIITDGQLYSLVVLIGGLLLFWHSHRQQPLRAEDFGQESPEAEPSSVARVD